MARDVKTSLFQHPLWDEAGEPLNEPIAQKLAVLVRLGDQDCFDEMVKGYMRLALSIVGKYLRLLKSKRFIDDLVSAAMEGVVLAINDVKENQPVENYAAHVATHVHGELGHLLRTMNSNQVKFESGMLLDYDRLILEMRDDENYARVEGIIEDNIENELEAQVVKLRKEGYTDEEIADQLEVSRSTVQVIRQDLYDRVRDLLPGRKNHENSETEETN